MLNPKEVKLYEEISCYGEKGLVTGTGPNGLHVLWPEGQMIYYRWSETRHLEAIPRPMAGARTAEVLGSKVLV